MGDRAEGFYVVCVECVRLVGFERAEWAALFDGDNGYCPDHWKAGRG